MSRRCLVRLYPREWRQRYGDEFHRLLEATPLSVGMVINVFGAAARQWIFRTLFGAFLIGPPATYVAHLAAQGLLALVPVEPTLIDMGGSTMVVPPWPVYLGLIHMAIFAAAFYRSGILRSRPVKRISEPELLCWGAALSVGSTVHQWGEMVLWMGTGVDPTPTFDIWKDAAIMGTVMLGVLLTRRPPVTATASQLGA